MTPVSVGASYLGIHSRYPTFLFCRIAPTICEKVCFWFTFAQNIKEATDFITEIGCKGTAFF